MPEPTAAAPERSLATPLHLDRLAANAETLEIPVSFASDRIVEDPWLGPVRLSLDPAAVDLSAAADKGIPVRIMHQRGLPPARVTGVAIDGHKLRGTMRFSASDIGRGLYRDAVDGILTDLSVGAAILAVREEPDHLVATRWTPREVSIVDEGADPSVGINRALFTPAATAAPPPTGVSTMTIVAEHPAAPEQTSPATAPTTLAREAANILELAAYVHGRYPELGVQRLGEEFCQFGRSFNEFQTEVWGLVRARKAGEPAVAPAPAEIGLTPQQSGAFSIIRAARAYLNKSWKGAEFELECSRAVAERLGRDPKGFFVPLEVQRTMTAGTAAAGGYLIGTEHREDLFIASLRARSVAMLAGARSLPGLVGNVSIPKLTGNGTFYWLTEAADVTSADLTVGAVTMTPRTVAGAVPMTRRLLAQSSPSIETLVREDLITGAALAIDLAIFEGSGAAGQPLGVVGSADVNTSAVGTDGSPTWAEMVAFETEVAADNALGGSMAYVMTPAVRGKLKTTAKDTGSGLMVLGDNGLVNGYPVFASSQLTTHRILFGNWAEVLVGFWGVLDVKPDEATLAASGGLILRVFQDCDVAVRHGQSFCYGT